MQLKAKLYPHGFLSLGVIVLIVSGCSGGSSDNNPVSLDSDSISIVDTTVLPDTIESTEAVDSNIDAMAIEDASVVVSDGSTAAQSTPDEAVINESEAESQTDSQAGSQAETQTNPVSSLITRVDFEIMVPAYMSNQLQIDMTWGSREIDVQWVGDESWFASEELPTNARLPLVIQFSDLDGDVVLGVHEADFETGTNASEIYVVSAENFNTEGWDDDNDGVSNLSESIAGTNPLIVEGPPLEVRDVYFDDGSFNVVVLANVARYESKLIELPYFEQLTEEATEPYESTTYTSRVLTIDVDENGTGTFDDQITDLVGRGDTTSVDYFATRTNTGDTISYMTTRRWWNSGAAVGENSSISSETEAVDAQSRFQTAELINSATIGNRFSENIDYSLTGAIIEGTANCEASHGTLSHKHTRYIVQGEERIISISKAVDDQYWYVAKTTPNGGVEEEYFVQNLGRQFYCDLTGL